LVLSGPIPGIDLVGESIAAVISLLITYYAHKAYRLSGQRSLFLLYLGFLLVGVGSIAQSIALLIGAFIPAGTQITSATLHGIIRLFVVAVITGYGIHWLLEILGYITIFIAYLYQSRDLSTTNTPIPTGLALQFLPLYIARAFSPPLELILFLLLIFILIQVIVIYLPRRHRNTLYVILGFLFLSLAHLAFILFSFFPDTAETVYALGHILQLTGFLLLLAMILGTTRGK
jgi:hypothetical protein